MNSWISLLFSVFDPLRLHNGEFQFVEDLVPSGQYAIENYFNITEMPDMTYQFPRNSICQDPHTDMLSLDGVWRISTRNSDDLDQIMRMLGQPSLNIRVMRSATPTSTFEVNSDMTRVTQSTQLPYGRRSGGSYNLTSVVSSTYDSTTGITWRNIHSGYDPESGALYSRRESEKGTMYDVRYTCTDRNGDDWMLFIFTLDQTQAHRWLKKI